MSVKTQDDPNDYGLIIKKTETMGFGVYTLKDIKKGEKICPYAFKDDQKMSLKSYREKYGKNNL